MEHVDGMPPRCNDRCCGRRSSSSAVERTAHRSQNAGPQTLSIVHKTNTICDDDSTVSIGSSSQRKRKLVLHFDVRNTILVSDSTTHDSIEQALNTFLTGVTWGRQEPNGWVWYSDRPSLRAPCAGVTSYYKSRERALVKSPADRVTLRRVTSNFTNQPIGRKFRNYFDTCLRLLEWNVACSSPEAISNFDCDKIDSTIASSIQNAPTKTQPEVVLPVDRKLTILGANGRLYHYLLPSFIKMLYDLQADGCRFSVILRTYGVDAPNVLDSIAHIAAGNHPLFPGKLAMNVNRRPGQICRQPGDRFVCQLPPTAHTSPPVVLETDADIYLYMSDVDGICGFVDDFRFWQDHNYTHSDGKPLWIDPADQDVQHIFFDDNIRIAADADSIVDVRLFDDASISGSGCRASARSLSIEEIAPLENVCLVQADLLEGTSNVDYFINMVRQCESNYSDWLQQHTGMHYHGGDI